MSDTKEEKKEVVIKLTEEQRQHIKKTTGKLVAELKVEVMEDRANPTAGINVVFGDGSVRG